MKTLENEFDEEMRNIYTSAKNEIGYNATRFAQLLSAKGGIASAKQLISKNGGTYGFEVLWENQRLDLSVENLVLQEKYCSLFTEEEKEMCRRRLQEFGFTIDK